MKTLVIVLLAAAAVPSWSQAQSRYGRRDRERDRSSSSYAQSSRADTGDFSQDYAIFSDLNIFERERHVRRSNDSGPKPLTPEETYVLTGIVQDMDNQYRANFENRARGGIQKVSIGSPLASGKITDIRADQALYEAGTKKVWVQIGSNLTGANAGGSDSSSGSDSAMSGPPIDPNAPGLTMEQRMRARRMQQMNGGAANPTFSSSAAPTPGAMPSMGTPPGGPPQFSNGGQPPQPPTGTGGDNVNGPPQQPTPNNGPPGAQPEGVSPVDAGEPNVIHNFPAAAPQTPTANPQGNF